MSTFPETSGRCKVEIGGGGGGSTVALVCKYNHGQIYMYTTDTHGHPRHEKTVGHKTLSPVLNSLLFHPSVNQRGQKIKSRKPSRLFTSDSDELQGFDMMDKLPT